MAYLVIRRTTFSPTSLRLLGVAMSDHVPLSGAATPAQSVSNVLGPGIVGLFVQGLETGLVISQLSQWLSLDRRDGFAITLLVIFVTIVGLLVFTSSPFSPRSHVTVPESVALRLLYVLCLLGGSMFLILDKL